MTNTLYSFLLFWAIWLLVPLFIDGTTTLAYLWGAWKVRAQVRRRRAVTLDYFPLVTIIIPAHNGGSCLKNCLASIRGQTYPHDKLEVIVVNNLSTDNSFAIFNEEQSRSFGWAMT